MTPEMIKNTHSINVKIVDQELKDLVNNISDSIAKRIQINIGISEPAMTGIDNILYYWLKDKINGGVCKSKINVVGFDDHSITIRHDVRNS